MSYAIPLRTECKTCGDTATYEVFNDANATMGYFCAKCANVEIERLKALEDPHSLPEASRRATQNIAKLLL